MKHLFPSNFMIRDSGHFFLVIWVIIHQEIGHEFYVTKRDSQTRCKFCRMDVYEDISHVLRNSKFKEIWKVFTDSQFLPLDSGKRKYWEWLESHSLVKERSKWRTGMHSVLWAIWRERNGSNDVIIKGLNEYWENTSTRTSCFIMSFTNKDPNPEKDSAAVQEFLTNMEGAFSAHSLWAGCSEEELECAGEGLEKYVMTKLFNRAFAYLPEERKHDEDLSDKMALVQKFIRPENLDIKPTFQNETSWLLAQKELQKINIYKAPRDKLVCILNCCKVINNLLLNASLSSSENPPGADEFLPVLIYVTIKANPPQLQSNLLYIQRYRRQSRLVSEAAYYFTNILSAESFIWSIDAQALSMDELEFLKNMEAAKAVLLGLSSETKDTSSQSTYENKFPSPSEVQVDRSERIKSKVLSDQAINMNSVQPQLSEAMKDPARNDATIVNKQSASVLETKGARFLLKEEQMSNYFKEFPFLYASAGNLMIDDVETLLDSYKQLVLKYVSLSKGLGVETFPSSLSEKPAHVDNGKEAGQENDQFNKFFESVENSKVTEESAQVQSVNEPIDDNETKSYNDKFDEFCETVESSIANTSGEVDGAIYSAPTVEPVVDSSSDNTQLQV